MNASAHGHVLRSRRLDGHRLEAGRERLAHLVNAYLDEMSKAVIGLVGHVLKRFGDGLMASSGIPPRRERRGTHRAPRR
jgi:class 3 adenylate cyclase